MENYKQIDVKSKGSVDENTNTNINFEELTCSFCGKKYIKEKDNGINFLISPLNEEISICDVCLDTYYEANKILRQNNVNDVSDSGTLSPALDLGKIEDYTPKIIKSELDKYVIGQEEAKRALSIAAYNHIKRINNVELDIDKTNVLLVGPSGCGKTYIVKKLANILKVPCISVDITAFSETGYKGRDISEILKSLYYAANGNIELAERGIVFIDEVDKIAQSGDNSTHVSDTKVQQGLLKLMEGATEEISDNENLAPIVIDTKNILFIFAGAFVGIEEFQKGNERSIGFLSTNVSSNQERTLKRVTAGQLKKYGMIPEFIGRVPKIVTLKSLQKEDYINIMKNSKDSAILQYQKLLDIDGYELEFTEDALDEIATKCQKTKLGARALRGIIEETMDDILFNGPNLNKKGKIKKQKEKIVVTRDMVLAHEEMFAAILD